MASIVELRNLFLSKPDIAGMIVPSAKFELYMDLNGDGKADFAFIDSSCNLTGKTQPDTFAIDLGADGEFDLYLRDTDGNFVADEITYFKDGTNEPVIQTHPEKSRQMIEAALAGPAKTITDVMTKLANGESSAEEFKAGMQAYIGGVRLALRQVYAAYMQSKQQ